MDHTHSTPSDNPEDDDFREDSENPARRIAAVWPEIGALNTTAWGELFNIKDVVVNRYLKKFNVRHKRAGDTNWIRPVDMWEALPFIGEEDLPPKRRK